MHIVSAYVRPGDVVIDATCGNGQDTLRLARMLRLSSQADAAPNEPAAEHTIEIQRPGRLFAFDIQPEAVEATRQLLLENGFEAALADTSAMDPERGSIAPACPERGSILLACRGHEHMGEYFRTHPLAAPSRFASAIVFNLGYLPGGDKSVTTQAETTLLAVKDALSLLRTDGLLCITMYSGHPEGAREKELILDFAAGLDSADYHVSYINMLNQRKSPPEILLISPKG